MNTKNSSAQSNQNGSPDASKSLNKKVFLACLILLGFVYLAASLFSWDFIESFFVIPVVLIISIFVYIFTHIHLTPEQRKKFIRANRKDRYKSTGSYWDYINHRPIEPITPTDHYSPPHIMAFDDDRTKIFTPDYSQNSSVPFNDMLDPSNPVGYNNPCSPNFIFKDN